MTKKQFLHEHVATEIGQRVVSGRYPPGVMFGNEQDLIEEFNVSRTAVREAVKVLNGKGMVESVPRLGLRVRPTSEWHMLDSEVLSWVVQSSLSSDLIVELYDLRLAFEPRAAYLAANRFSKDDDIAIRRALQGMTLYLDEEDRVRHDLAFHCAILDATGNRFYRSLGDMISVVLQHTFRLAHRDLDDESWVDEHKKVYDAIVAGNGQLASDLMSSLLENALNDLKQATRRASEEASNE
ncbi:putative Transcriptional regulator, GntR family [Vibrio nigripulchritudo MADA3029]|uniref:Transcriptional regulator, GntR family n=1 Tax=Vibrio nigripulchritudo SOn1 TaxID=1238450 RepID=A0AAV2VII5_9VIBR|nr:MULTISPECIES: FadR/GntR family transcriptional regulator [Vibrio]UAB71729.1 FadR family transcriptional regulator [Vibrio sp. SCSIO 43132]CCN36182.1 putative Transcriptional regulator, GntR family [Vibrio nigripulchritudo AM115]CCN43516.1 putative Transcriptional regulator, GntR family [Vibrio nigripulchritudo FTn2]CCN45980.1 putative Transcriptional regulator, GntR family [Vibrio nigripulchritudo MADA3020]CCN54103.1 putative Transcriptional regulator, GntR family [Vibrio nigripulchritudo M